MFYGHGVKASYFEKIEGTGRTDTETDRRTGCNT